MIPIGGGFSDGYSDSFGNLWHTYLGTSGTPRILYGDLAKELDTSIPEVTPSDATPTGGFFWVKYEQEQRRREEERKRLAALKKKAKEEKEHLVAEIAAEEIRIQEEEARLVELNTLTKLANEYEKEIRHITTDKIAFIAKDAINRHTYSAMERLERELGRFKEEEEFLLLATQILLND